MNVFAVERRDECLVQFGDDRVGGLVAFVLDCLHLLCSYTQIHGILQDAAEPFGAFRQIARKFCEKLEELHLAWDQAKHSILLSHS